MKTFRLYLGNDCNMNCSYCYESHSKNKDINFDILNKIIEYCNNKEENISIIFFGGEPTLYMDKIEYVIQNIYNKQVFYSIFTNGTHMKELVELENKYNIHITKILSNKTPTDVYNYEDYEIDRYNLILTPDTLKYIDDEYIKYIQNAKHIQHLLITFVIEANWKELDREYIINRINSLNNIYLLNKWKISFLYLNTYIRDDKYVNCCVLDTLNVSYNGDVLLCNRHCFSDSPTKLGNIGNVLNDEIDVLFEKRNKIANQLNNTQDCYYFEHLNTDRSYLENLIQESNLMFKPQNQQLYKLATRCGSCAG